MHEELEGRVGKAFRMPLEVGKVCEFARATHAERQPFGGEPPVIPATFLSSAVLWQDEGSSPWGGVTRNLSRILHGEQEFVFHGPPPRAGSTLTGQVRIDRVHEKQGRRGGVMTFIEVVTEFRDESGELVVEARNTTIETADAVEREER